MLIPHLHFGGDCLAAIALYEKAFHTKAGDVEYMADGEKIAHTAMRIHGQQVFLNDGFGNKNKALDCAVHLIVTFATADELLACYEILKSGDTHAAPFRETPYSKLCGNFMDAFGVLWGFMVSDEPEIETVVAGILAGEAQTNALAFIAYLRANGMSFDRGTGYWEDKFYWMITYKGASVCFLLLNGGGDNAEPEGLTVWSDDSDSNWFEDAPLDEHMKAIAWQNVDFCGACGGACRPGRRKTVFGKTFDHVCRTTMRFDNPDAEALECLRKLVTIRKQDILRRGSCT